MLMDDVITLGYCTVKLGLILKLNATNFNAQYSYYICLFYMND